jgi:hypothetical protein
MTRLLVMRVNFELGCVAVSSSRPIRAAALFVSALKAILPNGDDPAEVPHLDWREIGRCCVEIGRILTSLNESGTNLSRAVVHSPHLQGLACKYLDKAVIYFEQVTSCEAILF